MSSPVVIPSTTWQVSSKFTDSQPAPLQLDGVASLEIRDGIAPIVPSCRIMAEKSSRLTAPIGSATPTWAIPVNDAYVQLSCSPVSGASRDFQVLRSGVSVNGPVSTLTIEGVDPRSARLGRAICYNPDSYTSGSAFRFNPDGVGNRSASGPFTFDYSTGARWVRSTAFEPIFAAVNRGAVSYAFSGSDYAPLQTVPTSGQPGFGAYVPTLSGSWDCDGLTAMEALLTVLGTRGRWSFYVPAAGAIQLVDLAPTSGAALDLTAEPKLLSYAFERDQSNVVSEIIVQGAIDIRVYGLGLGTGLTADWSAADVTAYDAGDTSGPAFRRFKVTSPDAAWGPVGLWGSLPMTAAAAPALAETRPYLVFLQTGSAWANWNGKVTVAVENDRLMIDGGAAWVTAYRASSALRVTAALFSYRLPTGTATAATALTGISGITLRRDTNAFHVRVMSGTPYALSGTALTSTGSVADEFVGYDGSNSLNGIAAELGALALRQRPRLTWTVQGISTDNPPGTAVGLATLPGIGNVTINGSVLERVWRQSGPDATTTWTIDFPPVSQVGQL
jgi:hypothetical protein